MDEIPHGHEVSMEPAIQAAGVRQKLNEGHRGMRSCSAGCTLVLAALAAGCFVAAALWNGAMAAVGGLLGFGVLGGLVLVGANGADYRAMTRVLTAYTWQSWPVRWVPHEEAPETGVAHVDLVGPDGRTVCRLVLPEMGDDFFGEMRDGDELWFAGDARFGGVIARPGVPTWLLYAPRETVGRERGSELADRTARQTKLMPHRWTAGNG